MGCRPVHGRHRQQGRRAVAGGLDGSDRHHPLRPRDGWANLYYGGHRGRTGAGDPFDFSCIKANLDGQVEWIGHYANPRGYSLSHIRNELYGVKADASGVYLFGGTGDESGYSEQIAPYESSDVWNGWMLKVNGEGDILQSAVFCQAGVNTATEYGCLIDGGYVIFNDTDAGGDTEVGVMRIAEPQTTGVAEWHAASRARGPRPPAGRSHRGSPPAGHLHPLGCPWADPLVSGCGGAHRVACPRLGIGLLGGALGHEHGNPQVAPTLSLHFNAASNDTPEPQTP